MSSAARHIHLDPVGGIAGDMFAAALLDAFAELAEPCLAALSGLLADKAEVALAPAVSRGFAGARFRVTPIERTHAHRHWSDIRLWLQGAALPEGARASALDIFARLAEAEADVHGVAPDAVHFHEVGAIDSIADILAAALLIDALKAESWSVGPLPLGSGLARTEHGAIPVPGPATLTLLKGLEVVDDGVAGERVTPTGAAILAHLRPRTVRPSGALGAAGLGLGTRELPDRVNGLRAYEIRLSGVGAIRREEIAVLRFDVDDQTPEDLALALDRLRALDGVLDVTQAAAFGKKGRMSAQIRLLVAPERAEAAAEAAFRETTTIGLRIAREQRRVLPREPVTTSAGSVKRVMRPDDATAKLESDELIEIDGAQARAQRRAEAEAEALEKKP